MAYDYDVDILAAFWTGGEELEEPYASFLAENPTLTDDTAEARILSTIELMRSHMELLVSRTDGKLFHESIAKLIRHTAGGSNPFSPAASNPCAQGNIKFPTFPAGGAVDVIIDGTTTEAVSASGGDIDTVISELNVALDAPIAAVAEVTTATVESDSGGNRGGTYFTLNAVNDTTEYYVWLSHPGRAEVSTLVFTLSDTDGNQGGKYFTLDSAEDATEYYAWLSHPGRAEVTSITTGGDTSGSLGGTYFTLDSAGDVTEYYCWIDHPGLGESMSLDFTGITGASLPTGATPGAWFDITSTTTTYRCWFSDGSTTAPAVTTETLVAIPFTGAEAAQAISDLALTAIVTTTSDADFASFGNGGGTTPVITGTLATVGNVTDPVDGSVPTGATIATTTQGVAAAVDPTPGGTSITATIAVGDSAGTVATAVRTAIDGVGDFDAESDANPFLVTNTAVGVTTDFADVDTEFTISTTIQGVDVANDPAPGVLTSLPITYSIGSSASEIGGAARSSVGGNADFGTSGAGATCVITNAAVGATTNTADVDTEATVETTTDGVDVAVDPAPVGLTSITAIYAVDDSGAEIDDAIRVAVGANPDFGTEGTAPVVITNAETGPATDAADVSTEGTITTTVQGADAIGDSVDVTASRTAEGLLRFCAEGDNSFTLDDAGGGILGPAGMFAGANKSAIQKIADDGRDKALGHFAGFKREPDLT